MRPQSAPQNQVVVWLTRGRHSGEPGHLVFVSRRWPAILPLPSPTATAYVPRSRGAQAKASHASLSLSFPLYSGSITLS